MATWASSRPAFSHTYSAGGRVCPVGVQAFGGSGRLKAIPQRQFHRRRDRATLTMLVPAGTSARDSVRLGRPVRKAQRREEEMKREWMLTAAVLGTVMLAWFFACPVGLATANTGKAPDDSARKQCCLQNPTARCCSTNGAANCCPEGSERGVCTNKNNGKCCHENGKSKCCVPPKAAGVPKVY